MLLLRDLPKYETIRQYAKRYPEVDPRAVESFIVLLRVASDTLAAFERYLGRRGMSQGKFTVLALLNREPEKGVLPSELADRAGVTRSTITGLLDGLEREDLITREGHADDRRKAVVRLTARGIRFLDSILPDYYRQIASLMGGLTESQKLELVTLLSAVNEQLPGLRLASDAALSQATSDGSADAGSDRTSSADPDGAALPAGRHRRVTR